MLVASSSAVVLAACGGSGEAQDEDEPAGEFPVRITQSDFPPKQRLARTVDLKLGIQNIGDETLPDLAITISTESAEEGEAGADPDLPVADESFSVPLQREDLAIPSRPVWVLENGYPKLAGEEAPAGASAAQTKTFSFGPLESGASREMIWRLTPVVAGTYTVSYTVSASLEGKAKAVSADGSVPEGEFVVRISDVPPQTRVDESGKVVPIEPGDIIGQAGSEQQKEELDSGGE